MVAKGTHKGRVADWCDRCGRKGHERLRCDAHLSRTKCFKCGEVGHISLKCRKGANVSKGSLGEKSKGSGERSKGSGLTSSQHRKEKEKVVRREKCTPSLTKSPLPGGVVMWRNDFLLPHHNAILVSRLVKILNPLSWYWQGCYQFRQVICVNLSPARI